MNDRDITDAQWAHHEQVQRQYEEFLRRVHPEWFIHYPEDDMKVSQMIDSKFLKKEDFPEDQICTIRGIKQENVGREDVPEMRWTLYFAEQKKPMVLNVTSIRVLESAFGDESDNWRGKKVTIYVDPNVSFQGRVVGGLRLRPIKDKPTQVEVARVQAKAAQEALDDSIPF
jgi:hypothetical protein